LPEALRELRRAQIIQAARALVAKDGLEGLTIARLERQLGQSRGVITYHFRNKEEIVDSLLESAIAEVDYATRAEVASARTVGDRAGAVIRAVVRGFLSRVEAVRILVSFWGRLHADPRIRAANAALYARYRAETAALLGGRRSDHALATVVVGVVLGIAAQSYFDPQHVDVEAAVEEAIAAVRSRISR
jgi:TetR/AcrR family transcriptional repressor of bet genes